MKPTISIATIVKNEALGLKDYFDSVVGFADEIIIVDTGSTDESVNIIKEYQTRYSTLVNFFVYPAQKEFHYGHAKNFSITKSSKDYVLVLDADERLSEEFKKNVKTFLDQNNPDVVCVIRHDDLLPHLKEPIERIIKRDKNIFYGTDDESKVHEHFVHNYPVIIFKAPLWHCQRGKNWLIRPHSRFHQHLALEIDRIPKTKSFLGHLLRGMWMFQYKFKRVYISQQIYKDGAAGLRYSFLRAFYAFFIQFFVGLKQENYKYWEKKDYKEKIK